MSGIYIHIPFCRHKCFYCNFYSINHLKRKEDVEKTIVAELSLRKDFLQDSLVETIYFGGGTPTLMGIKSLEHIINTIYQHFHVADEPEITIEANPDDLSFDFSQELRHLCNRLSIGVQSFQDEELQLLGRLHNAETAKNAIQNVRRSGFDNISIDLIYGINNDMERFQKSVETVLAFSPEHLSAYALTCEPHTVLDTLVKRKQHFLASDEAIIDQYRYLIETLKDHHFHHYEISNFALSGYEARHNSSYWNGTPYLGVGPAAHSFSGKIRQWNIASVEQYVQAMESGKWTRESEELTEYMQYEELVMLRLRTSKGVDIQEVNERFGVSIAQQLSQKAQKYIVTGDMVKQNGTYRIAEHAFLISDTIIADLV